MTTFHGLYSNSPPPCLEHRTFLYTAQQKLIVSLSPSFLREDNQYEECWASQTCHQLHQFYLLVNLQRVNSSGEILNNIFTYIDKINYRRAILFLNIDFKKGMHEFLDKQTRTSIMQFTLTLSEIRRKKREFLKVVTCWLRPTIHHSICTKYWTTYLKSLLFSLGAKSDGLWQKQCMRSWAGLCEWTRVILTKAMVGILNHCCFKRKTHIMVKLNKKKIKYFKRGFNNDFEQKWRSKIEWTQI